MRGLEGCISVSSCCWQPHFPPGRQGHAPNALAIHTSSSIPPGRNRGTESNRNHPPQSSSKPCTSSQQGRFCQTQSDNTHVFSVLQSPIFTSRDGKIRTLSHLTQLCISQMGREEHRGQETPLESHSNYIFSQPDFPRQEWLPLSVSSLPAPVPAPGALLGIAHKPGVILHAKRELLTGHGQHRRSRGLI